MTWGRIVLVGTLRRPSLPLALVLLVLAAAYGLYRLRSEQAPARQFNEGPSR